MFSDLTSSAAIGHSNSNPSPNQNDSIAHDLEIYRVVLCTVAIGPNLETFIRKRGEAYIVKEDE